MRGAWRIETIGLVAILALASWLRLAGLDRTSLFGDEAVYSGQAAALAGDTAAATNFGILLAHPVLFQLLHAAGFVGGLPLEGGRILTALFGVGAVFLVWAIGRLVGGRLLGLAAALLLAVLAHHAYLSRLVLLDGPAAFWVACSLYGFLRATRDRSETWLAASAGFLGLAVLTKETALLILPGVVVAAVLEPRLRLGLRAWVLSAASFVAVVSAFLLSVLLGGGLHSTMEYLAYQLSRHEQSPPLTYVQLIEPYFGWPFIALGVLGLLVGLRRGGHLRTIAIWALVPGAILQAWGLRELQLPMLVGLQITLLVAIGIEAIANGASSVLTRRGVGKGRGDEMAIAIGGGLLFAMAMTLVPRTLEATSLPAGAPIQSGLREASLWLRDHAGRDDGVFVSTAYKSSVVAYYSGQPSYGFIPAANRDPLYRDPGNVRAFWRAGGIQWVVLDNTSQAQAASSDTDRGPYDRLVLLLASDQSELAHVVPGPTPDRWLAQVYEVTEPGPAGRTIQAPTVTGRGNRLIVALSYAVCIASGGAIFLSARRSARRTAG